MLPKNQTSRKIKIEAMANFKMKGDALYDKSNRKVGTIRGDNIYDNRNRKVGAIRGDNIYDSRNRKVASVRGSNIYDSRNSKIGSITDATKAIDGAMGGMSVIALWVSFVR